MIARALNALGFGRKPMPTAIASNDQALRATTASRDDWKRLAEETGERFKLAATDLAKQAEEIAGLHRSNAGFAAQVEALRPDAEAWRDRQRKSADYEKNRRVRPAKKGAK